jgi:mannan endo-1,4-beta-mannosidase
MNKNFIWIAILLIAKMSVAQTCNVNATPEAKALLKLFYDISGQYLLTGQHNFPNVKDRNSVFATNFIGKPPAVWSTDMGFEREGNTDSYLARPDIVKEGIRQHQMGSIITICWHAVPPTAVEPVTFQPRTGADSSKLESVQGKLLNQQFKDLLTPGTIMYTNWARQVDSVAVYLKKMQDAKVPILWRPYHEMNGDWFWWGGRRGEYSTIKLYRQLYDRLVKHHKINNLVWVWSVDRPSLPSRQFKDYFVGADVFDITAIDIYGNDFAQRYYDELLQLSNGKPMVLGEVGNPPSQEVMRMQPKWAYYVTWAGMVRNTTKEAYESIMKDSRVLNHNDAAYENIINKMRKSINLAPLTLVESSKMNLNGSWILDEAASKFDNRGASNQPALLDIQHNDSHLTIKRSYVSEYGDNNVSTEQLPLHGQETEVKAPFGNFMRMMSANMSPKNDTVTITSKFKGQGAQPREFTTIEKWTMQNEVITITTKADSPFGKREFALVFKRRKN